jgi:hypothetical protein
MLLILEIVELVIITLVLACTRLTLLISDNEALPGRSIFGKEGSRNWSTP